MQKAIHLDRKSKLIFLLQVTRSMLLQSPKEKDSRALLKDMDSPEDLWLMVLNTTDMQVPTALQHMGAVKVTVQNLEVVRVDADQNLILVKGSVPGPKKSLVMLKESVKA